MHFRANYEFPSQIGLVVVWSAMNGCFRLQEKTFRRHRFDGPIFKNDFMPVVHFYDLFSAPWPVFPGRLCVDGLFV